MHIFSPENKIGSELEFEAANGCGPLGPVLSDRLGLPAAVDRATAAILAPETVAA